MDMSIHFPHLGIHLGHVGKTIQFLGIDIAYYGIVIAVSMIAGVALVLAEARRTGQDEDFYLDMLILSIVIGIVGARAYYVVFSWDSYKDDLLEIFNIRNGGLAIYGGILSGVATACIYTRRKKIPLGQMVDTACLGLVLGQILGRWGNFFNREAFGGYTDNLLAMQLPVDAVRQREITAQMWEHVQSIGGVAYIQVHPTFLYESMWNILVLAFLLWYRKKKRFQGEVFLLYLVGYGLGRVWIEGLRTDQLRMAVLGLRFPVSQLLSLILVVASGGFIVFLRHRKKGEK
ncbi:MAG: prolipoprotein diacylglyceryl transferase [Lachnospiraceae bacterium]|jgi:phosphatidylglycerol:prolipoprotein diacylglycerol transferase|nr:prolipoprotein diacylglyceryl transferase [Lachnospiraceae bacterium]